MKKTIFLLILFIFLLHNFCSSQIETPHTTKEITFQADKFHVVGELRLPKVGTKHPLVIMVHGDGPAYRRYFAELKECMLRAGYATLMWDKPGYGKSKGEFSEAHLRQERAQILVDAIHQMKKRPEIDADHIGVWGISQAGYVIPKALQQTEDISFMIMVGCPGENGINQTAYLIRKQLQYAGLSEKEAEEAENHFIQLFYAESFEQYIKHAKPLYDNPIQRELGFVSALWDKDNWKPFKPDRESFFNPMDIIKTVTIPSLVLFGEKDTQVDPIQGKEAYVNAFQTAGNKNYRIELIPNADHNIILSETGSMKERSERSSKEWSNYAPEYLIIMEDWLKQLKEIKE
jgi:pimeloyl-ACP methyl ester carboxylesterase